MLYSPGNDTHVGPGHSGKQTYTLHMPVGKAIRCFIIEYVHKYKTSESTIWGESRISGKGVHMYKGEGGRFAGFIYIFFRKYPMKMK